MMIQNPHDKFFKETFGKVEVAKDFLINYLPENIIKLINMDTLTPQKDTFINDELEEGFSDLLFKADINENESYIYFLFEHKSYLNKNIAFQLLKYIIKIWETKIEKENQTKLPLIIPLVIYHGKDKWNLRTTLDEIITGYQKLPKDIIKYIPNYEYLLYDLSRYTDEEIKGEALLKIALTIQRDILTKDYIGIIESMLKATNYIRELENKATGIEYFETMIRYLFYAKSDIDKADINEIIEKIENTYPEGSEIAMTLAERLEAEGISKGINKGINKGKKEAIGKTAIRLLTKRFGILPEDIRAAIERLDVETLEVVIDGIFEYKSIEDVRKYII